MYKLYNEYFTEVTNIKIPNVDESLKTLFILSEGGDKRGYVSLFQNLINSKLNNVSKIFVNEYPSLTNLNALIQGIELDKVSLIVAIGGGSVIDTAKILASFSGLKDNTTLTDAIKSPDILSEYDKKLKLLVLPTTAGTGAEATQFSTIWDRKNNKKLSLDHPNLLPDSVYFIPEILITSSYETALFTALDTFSHSLESIWNINSSKESLKYSHLSLKNSFLLKKLSLNNKNASLLKNRFKSSYFAGKAINITRTSLAHSISYPLTLKYNVPHGLACSFTLDAIFQISKKHIKVSDELLIDIEESLKNLKSYNLVEELNKYLNLDQALNLIDKMSTKERTKNFISKVDKTVLKEILKSSF